MPNPSTIRYEAEAERGASGTDGAQTQVFERARLRASLAGFEERLRRCRRELLTYFDEHRGDLRAPSELAFLLGQMHALIEHCRDLEGRYRMEQVILAARDGAIAPAIHPG